MISKLTLLTVLLVSVYAGDHDNEVETSHKKEVWTWKTVLQTSYSDNNNFAVLRANCMSPANDFSINSLASIQIASGLVSEKDKPFWDNVVAVLKIDEVDEVADFILGSEQEVEIKHDDRKKRTVRLTRDPESGAVNFEINDPNIKWGQTKGTGSGSLTAELAKKVAHDLKETSELFQLVSNLQNDSKGKSRFAIEFVHNVYSKVQTATEENGDAADEAQVKIDSMTKAIRFTDADEDDIGDDLGSFIDSIGSPDYVNLPQVKYLYKALNVEQDDHHDQE